MWPFSQSQTAETSTRKWTSLIRNWILLRHKIAEAAIFRKRPIADICTIRVPVL